jgi:hypothetical protein
MAWLWQQYQDNSLNIAVICAAFLILSMARQAWLRAEVAGPSKLQGTAFCRASLRVRLRCGTVGQQLL